MRIITSTRLFGAALMSLSVVLTCNAETSNTISYTTQAGRTVTITPVSDYVVSVSNTAKGQAQAVPDSPAIPGVKIDKLNDNIMSMTIPSGIIVTTNTKTGEVTINAGQGKIIYDRGVREQIDGSQTLTLTTTSTGSYYGAGERGHKLNMRGDTLVMYNRQNYGYTKGDPRISQMNITMPLVISSDGFGLLFDDFGAATLTLSKGSEITYTTESNTPVDYYFVDGATDIADVTEAMTSVTGRQPLPPLWSLGYITSKYGYHNEKETLGAIDSLKQRGYPVDGIVLDLYWYGKEQDMGRLAWDPVQWPSPEKMLSKLKKDNVHLVAISQPYILRNGQGLDNYNYLAERGMLMADSTGKAPQEVEIWVGEGGMFDVSNPDTKKWLANRYKELTDMGVSGWWGDLGEPEVHPQTGLHDNGLTARQYHNKYGNDWSEIIYDMFAEEYPDTRLLTMMRGGTTGLQKYSVFPWSTDVSRSWEGLQPQITIMLNSGLSGLGYMGHDVGGFAVDPENPVDPELYVRWLQLGLFSPMLRTHAQHNAEPYHYPEYSDIILPLIKERYRWLPYNYTLAYENAKSGYPLVRPLNFNETGATQYDSIDNEYLWGNEVLVAPVMQKGATQRAVTFPKGTWIDYANPEKTYQGGTTITYPAPLDVLPLFVRAGAFIPTADYSMKSTADYNPAELTINYYPSTDTESEYTMYDDNRMSPKSLADNEYRLVRFKGEAESTDRYTITITSTGTYQNAPKKLDLTFKVYGTDINANNISIDNGALKMLKSTGNTLCFKVTYIPGTTTTINVNK